MSGRDVELFIPALSHGNDEGPMGPERSYKRPLASSNDTIMFRRGHGADAA